MKTLITILILGIGFNPSFASEALDNLSTYIEEGNLEKVKLAASSPDFDVNEVLYTTTPLSYALESSRPEIAKFLLTVPNIDVNVVGGLGTTPILLAGLKGYLEIIKTLVEKGAEVNFVTEFRYSIFNTLLESSIKDKEILEFVIKSGANIHFPDTNGNYPLHLYASHKSKINLVRVLLGAGVMLNLPNYEGKTPLKVAVEKGNEEIAKLLRDAGAVE